MKITHYVNAFLSIRENSTTLACDPWIGVANYGGWMSYPISEGGVKLLKELNPTHVYISHIHSDHIDENLLPKGVDKDIPIIIKTFTHRHLFNKIQKLGFTNIIELEPWKGYKLNDDLEIVIVPTDVTNVSNIEDAIEFDIDTSIIIKSLKDNKIFYNNVDSPISYDALHNVKKFIEQYWNTPTLDISCFSSGAASSYPQCFMNIDRYFEQKRIITSSIQDFSAKLEALENETYFFAGGSYFIPGKYWRLNKYIAQPTLEQLKPLVEKSKYCKELIDINGGYSIEYIDGCWIKTKDDIVDKSFSNKDEAIKANKDMIYDYKLLEPAEYDSKMIEELLEIAKKNYFTSLESFNIQMDWKVVFKLYDDLQVDEKLNISVDSKPLQILTLFTQKDCNNELVCHMDYSLFIGLLNKKFNWNISLAGSVILFERNPNIYIPTITSSLNYLTI